jgi:hypothetical protein
VAYVLNPSLADETKKKRWKLEKTPSFEDNSQQQQLTLRWR